MLIKSVIERSIKGVIGKYIRFLEEADELIAGFHYCVGEKSVKRGAPKELVRN